jgi:hypothetical protein
VNEDSVAMTKKHFKLQSHSLEELERRIETFGHALRIRSGAVLRVKRKLPTLTRGHCATIHYQLPLASLRGEARSRSLESVENLDMTTH